MQIDRFFFWLITSLNHLHMNRWPPQYWWIQSQLPVYKNSSVARTTWDPNLSQESLPVCVIYCWWRKSCTSWYGETTIIYRVLYISGGAGFLPSTVSQDCLESNDSLWKVGLDSQEKSVERESLSSLGSQCNASNTMLQFTCSWHVYILYIYVCRMELHLGWWNIAIWISRISI